MGIAQIASANISNEITAFNDIWLRDTKKLNIKTIKLIARRKMISAGTGINGKAIPVTINKNNSQEKRYFMSWRLEMQLYKKIESALRVTICLEAIY